MWAVKFYNPEEPHTLWSQSFKTKKQAERALWRFSCNNYKYEEKLLLPLQERYWKWLVRTPKRRKANIIL